jgi:hypothetical protein
MKLLKEMIRQKLRDIDQFWAILHMTQKHWQQKQK